jgi:glycosyltransferase involved in cell wall biosynthesis
VTDEPTVSVIIPVLNHAAGLTATLGALAEQRFPVSEREIIVVDNGSIDDSLWVASDYAEKIPGLRVETEVSVRSSYAARNRGIELAAGEVLAFTDADCRPARYWLKNGLKALDSGAEAAAGRIDMTFEHDEPNLWEYLDSAMFLDQERWVARHGFGATANLFVRRKVFGRLGRFRSDLISGGDYEFGRRLARVGSRVAYSREALVSHPARASREAVFRKTKRVARGLRELERLELLQHNLLSWRHFMPVWRYPSVPGLRITAPRKLAVIVMANVLKFWSTIWRIM